MKMLTILHGQWGDFDNSRPGTGGVLSSTISTLLWQRLGLVLL